MPVKKTGLILYDTKTSNTEVLIKLDKMYDTLGLSFVDGVITFFGRTQIPNVFDIRKLSEYVIWNSDCSPKQNGPYKLEIDSMGVPAVYNADRSRVFPVLEFK